MVPVVVLWMMWVKVVVVVFLLFLYGLFNFRWSIRWVTYVGHSIWAVYGQLIVWVGRECIVALGPRRVSASFRGTGALGPGVGVGVSCAMLWGFRFSGLRFRV